MAAPILPPELQKELDDAARKYSICIHTQEYDTALNIITDLRDEMLRWQQKYGQRFHKGYPLHNIGYTLYQQNKYEEALKYIILAYIEDLLSADLGNEDEADLTPAGQTLFLGYKYDPKILKQLKQRVASFKEQGKPPLSPEYVIEKFGEPLESIRGEITAEPKFDDNPKRENKVFIGGSGRLIPTINFMRDTVAKLGFYPVVAGDYSMPDMNIYRKCLHLLHGCKYAIIDLSEQAGQLIEADRAAEYGVKTLVIWPKGREENVTKMLTDAFQERGIQSSSYERFSELEDIFRKFLRES